MKNTQEDTGRVFQFPTGNEITAPPGWPCDIVINSDTEYGREWGLEIGSSVSIGDPKGARIGDVVLVNVSGKHQFVNFNYGDHVAQILGVVEARNLEEFIEQATDRKIAAQAPWPRRIALNATSSYSWTFGLQKGDTITVHDPAGVQVGDLVLCDISGKHQFSTFNDGECVNNIVGKIDEDHLAEYADVADREDFDEKLAAVLEEELLRKRRA